MKTIILFVLVLFILNSCSSSATKNQSDNEISKFSSVFESIKSFSKPMKFEIESSLENDYVHFDLDSFLVHYGYLKSNIKDIDSLFKNKTVDFVSENKVNFMHYPYDGKAFAIGKIKVNTEVTAIFYAYILESEIIQPRIEIQTFNQKGEFRDALIVVSTFLSECTGSRDFYLSKNNKIQVADTYGCSSEVGGDDMIYRDLYNFIIDLNGKFVKVNP